MNKNTNMVILAALALLTIVLLIELQSSQAQKEIILHRQAPVVMSDDNVYVSWWTNETGSDSSLSSSMFTSNPG